MFLKKLQQNIGPKWIEIPRILFGLLKKSQRIDLRYENEKNSWFDTRWALS